MEENFGKYDLQKCGEPRIGKHQGHKQQEGASATPRWEGTSRGNSSYHPRKRVAEEKCSSRELCLVKGLPLPSRGGPAGWEAGRIPIFISSCPSGFSVSWHWLNPGGSQGAGVQLMQPMEVLLSGPRRVLRGAAQFACLALWIELMVISTGSQLLSMRHWFLGSPQSGMG